MDVDVSVIIPTYNRLWCLPKAIESCRSTKFRTEIIVVDDGSNDGTWEWLQIQKDVVPIYQPNQGQTWAINRGFSVAKGKYIRFLDSDDILCLGAIDKQFETAVATGANLVYSRVDAMNYATGEIIEHSEPAFWDDFLAVQLGEGYGSHFLGMLFERDLVEKVPRRPDFAYREDRMFLLEVGLLNPKLAHASGCAGYWIRHERQMQANYRGIKAIVTNWQHLGIYKYILHNLEQRGELTQRRRKAACRVLWPLAHWIAYTHLDEACEVVEWIYQLDPEFQPYDLGILGKFYQHLGFRNTERILRFRRNTLKIAKKILQK
ncbi:glycosyltransferase family 2 protein [Tumidithrix elongata RA019]|uniref:Glycosyltransferase family 2 protein n=1 Tax=Tumidithrix elongata BACA0141 TaxID=2716417 RepID=A0AAW9PPR2_9CYAN|nr:glycosyltransferase family 2 protein [Tumidithrix elongata RA019]